MWQVQVKTKKQVITTTVVDVKDTIGQHKETDLLVNMIYRESERERRRIGTENERVVGWWRSWGGGGGGRKNS